MSDKKLAKASFNEFSLMPNNTSVWSPKDVDKMEVMGFDDFANVVRSCRFFYRRDPLVSTVVNKLVELGMNRFIFSKKNLNQNELKTVTGLLKPLKEFASMMALEYLVSGLVCPEVKFTVVPKNKLQYYGIKKYESLSLPTEMWLRDPATIKINSSMLGSKLSYFVKIPDKLKHFIQSQGVYPDLTEDKVLYKELVANYPQFVADVRAGKDFVLLENDLIFLRNPLSDSPYPTPYLYPSLEILKQKRNLRRMDYSVASRVITAIMLVKLGNDEFPMTEDDEADFNDIKNQMQWRNTTGDVERIFQLFGNHTLSIEWIMPDVSVLLNDAKYAEVNQEILYGMGFPHLLIVGETKRSSSSDPEFAIVSPIATMEVIRDKVIFVINNILYDVFKENGFKGETELQFAPLDKVAFSKFIETLNKLYEAGNISRTEYDETFGYFWEDQLDKREEEQRELEDRNLPEFSPTPNSRQPNIKGQVVPKNPAMTPKSPVVKPKEVVKNEK
jgi:hypothetical protein